MRTEKPSSPAALIAAARELSARLAELRFAAPVTHVYDPLRYAAAMHEAYVRQYGGGAKRVVFLGMNPGPFGMAQTGIPFGEIAAVRDWLRLSAPIGKPKVEHAKRPVLGLACARSEVSGRRLWGLFAARFVEPERFFAEHYVANWCPLSFMEKSGRNRTPDQLAPAERSAVALACDRHLAQVLAILRPRWVVGIGRFAAARAGAVATGADAPQVAAIPHPSPANPAANRGWDRLAVAALEAAGVWPAKQPRRAR